MSVEVKYNRVAGYQAEEIKHNIEFNNDIDSYRLEEFSAIQPNTNAGIG